MILFPKKVKHRKWHRLVPKRVASRANRLAFGSIGLKALSGGWVTGRQIEAARRAIMRHIKKGGKLWIRVFPDQPVTAKGLGVTMGGGKGTVDHYVARVKTGTVMFELDGLDEDIAQEALILAGHKLPLKTKVIKKL